MKKLLILLLLLPLMISCQEQVEDINAQRLSQLSELGTVEYTISKVIKASDDKNIKAIFGTRKIIYNSQASIKAGFDMSELKDEDIQIKRNAKEIIVNLPQPKLLSLNMDPSKIHLVYEESTGFRDSFTPEERLALQQQAEKDILENISELGIMEDARKYGTEFLSSFLHQCGYKTITINFKK